MRTNNGLLVALLFAATPVHADIYMAIDKNGVAMFADRPIPGGQLLIRDSGISRNPTASPALIAQAKSPTFELGKRFLEDD